MSFPVQFQSIFTINQKMAYIDEGESNKIVLFIHGLGLSHLSWQKNVEYLKDYCRCIALDLPGNGMSDVANTEYSIHYFVESIKSFLEERKISKVYIAGHSMGGQVAMAFAIKYPHYVRGLILCAPAGFETFNDWEKNLYRSTLYFMDLVSNEENAIRKSVQNSFFILPEYANEMIKVLIEQMQQQGKASYRKMIEQCISTMLDEPVYHNLEQIKSPVQIIFGEKDTMIPNRFIHPISTGQLAEKAVIRFPNATLNMLPLCGHFVQMEKPVQVNSIIRYFVNKEL